MIIPNSSNYRLPKFLDEEIAIDCEFFNENSDEIFNSIIAKTVYVLVAPNFPVFSNLQPGDKIRIVNKTQMIVCEVAKIPRYRSIIDLGSKTSAYKNQSSKISETSAYKIITKMNNSRLSLQQIASIGFLSIKFRFTFNTFTPARLLKRNI